MSLSMIDQLSLALTFRHDRPLLVTSLLSDIHVFMGWVRRSSGVGRPTDASEGINALSLPVRIYHMV